MSEKKSSSKSAGAGVLVAITASLCCITPVLALISGTSGIAASFSWMEPYRPFLIGLTVLVLGFAWYQKFLPAGWLGKPKTAEIDCECEPAQLAGGEDEKTPFMQSKMFLGIVTLFAAMMLTFPFYSSNFYPDIKKDDIAVNKSTIYEVSLAVKGMTCTGCEAGIEYAAMKLPGVLTASADFIEGSATIRFDQSTSTEQDIIDAINATGYKVVSSVSINTSGD